MEQTQEQGGQTPWSFPHISALHGLCLLCVPTNTSIYACYTARGIGGRASIPKIIIRSRRGNIVHPALIHRYNYGTKNKTRTQDPAQGQRETETNQTPTEQPTQGRKRLREEMVLWSYECWFWFRRPAQWRVEKRAKSDPE
jgi:hypothetical protein